MYGTGERLAARSLVSCKWRPARYREEAARCGVAMRMSTDLRESLTVERGGGTPVLTFMIADDNAAYREGVRAALEGHDFALAGEASNVETAVAVAAAEKPDVCLIDLNLPGNGLSAVARIVKSMPTATVVVLGESTKSADVLAVFERGASGYLLKGISGDELATSLRAAYSGEPALSRALVPLLVYQVRRANRRRLVLPTGAVSLTAREWDVGELLCQGLATDEMAARLGLSPVTVRRHVGLLVKKIGAPNREVAIETLRMFAR
jgi:two-component system, NarL family, nitrate/nitrite response regulator NarL